MMARKLNMIGDRPLETPFAMPPTDTPRAVTPNWFMPTTDAKVF